MAGPRAPMPGPQSAPSMTNGSVTVTLPARSVTTLVTTVGGTVPPGPAASPSASSSPAGGAGPGWSTR
ncbi:MULTISPECIES: hypothetical protein [unclassified Actinoplanes]|uniref:hypothetical protein n=1 Tax=unclassified Actinoplanes TaxID=2626549 RepID=UPI000C073D34|nr:MULTISPECIES: hypothetical protein [unclassified Actinoplanes]